MAVKSFITLTTDVQAIRSNLSYYYGCKHEIKVSNVEGATTISIMTLSIITFTLMTLSTMTLTIKALSIATLIIT